MKSVKMLCLIGLGLLVPFAGAQGSPTYQWPSQGHPTYVTQIAAAPNGNYVSASVSYLRLWKSSDRTQITFASTGQTQYAMGFYSDGTALVTSDASNLHVRDPLTLAEPGAAISISDVGAAQYLEVRKVGPDYFMLTVHSNDAIKWQLVAGTWNRVYTWTSLGTWDNADLNPAASLWAVSNHSTNSVRVFNFTSPSNIATNVSVASARGVDFSPSGTYLAVGTSSTAVTDGLTLLKTSDWSVYQTLLKGQAANLVRYSTGDSSLWVTDTLGRTMYISYLGFVGFRSPRSYNAIDKLERTGTNVAIMNGYQAYPALFFTTGIGYVEAAHSGRTNGIAYREDNATLYTAGADGFLNEWAPASGINQYHTFLLAGAQVERVVASAGANRVVTCGNGTIDGNYGFQIMDQNLRLIREIPTFASTSTRRIAITKVPVGNNYIIACSDGNVITFYRASDGAILRTLTMASTSGILDICFSKDGTRFVAINGNQNAYVIRTTDFVLLQTITHTAGLYAVSWGYDNATFYLGTTENAQTIRPVIRTSLAPEVFAVQAGFALTGNEDAVFLKASRDNTTILVGTPTRMFQIDSVNKAQLHYWDSHTTDVLAADFSGDNYKIAYGFDNSGFGVFTNIYAGAIKSLNFNKASVVRGGAFIATINLTLPAPAGGTVIQLRTGTANITPTTFNVTIPAGATSATLSLTTNAAMTAGSYPITIQNMAIPAGGSHWLKTLNITVTN